MEHNENERLRLFTDAVTAITITLLVLELRPPPGVRGFDDAALWLGLLEMWRDLLAYVVSFLVIGALWVSYQRKLRMIVRTSRTMVWLNLLFLMVLALIPFTTRLIAENPGAVATSVYAGVVALCGLLLLLMWVHAEHSGLLAENIERRSRKTLIIRSSLSVALFALSMPLAFFEPDLAKFSWLLMLPITILGGRKRSAL